MDGARRRMASLPALGGAIGALAVDALYLNLIAGQGAMMPGGRVPFIALWIAIAAVLAGIGAFTDLPARRAWLLGWSAAADCGDITFRSFTVLPPDPHGFDGNDNDGIGCES